MAICFLLNKPITCVLFIFVVSTISTNFQQLSQKIREKPTNSKDLNNFLKNVLEHQKDLEWVDRLGQQYKGIPDYSSPESIGNSFTTGRKRGLKQNYFRRFSHHFPHLHPKLDMKKWLRKLRNKRDSPLRQRMKIIDVDNGLTGVLMKDGYKQQSVGKRNLFPQENQDKSKNEKISKLNTRKCNDVEKGMSDNKIINQFDNITEETSQSTNYQDDDDANGPEIIEVGKNGYISCENNTESSLPSPYFPESNDTTTTTPNIHKIQHSYSQDSPTDVQRPTETYVPVSGPKYAPPLYPYPNANPYGNPYPYPSPSPGPYPYENPFYPDTTTCASTKPPIVNSSALILIVTSTSLPYQNSSNDFSKNVEKKEIRSFPKNLNHPTFSAESPQNMIHSNNYQDDVNDKNIFLDGSKVHSTIHPPFIPPTINNQYENKFIQDNVQSETDEPIKVIHFEEVPKRESLNQNIEKKLTFEEAKKAQEEAEKLMNVDKEFNERNEEEIDEDDLRKQGIVLNNYDDVYPNPLTTEDFDNEENKYLEKDNNKLRPVVLIKQNNIAKREYQLMKQKQTQKQKSSSNQVNDRRNRKLLSYEDMDEIEKRYVRDIDYENGQSKSGFSKDDFNQKLSKLKDFFGFGHENNYNEDIPDSYPMEDSHNEGSPDFDYVQPAPISENFASNQVKNFHINEAYPVRRSHKENYNLKPQNQISIIDHKNIPQTKRTWEFKRSKHQKNKNKKKIKQRQAENCDNNEEITTKSATTVETVVEEDIDDDDYLADDYLEDNCTTTDDLSKTKSKINNDMAPNAADANKAGNANLNNTVTSSTTTLPSTTATTSTTSTSTCTSTSTTASTTTASTTTKTTTSSTTSATTKSTAPSTTTHATTHTQASTTESTTITPTGTSALAVSSSPAGVKEKSRHDLADEAAENCLEAQKKKQDFPDVKNDQTENTLKALGGAAPIKTIENKKQESPAVKADQVQSSLKALGGSGETIKSDGTYTTISNNHSTTTCAAQTTTSTTVTACQLFKRHSESTESYRHLFNKHLKHRSNNNQEAKYSSLQQKRQNENINQPTVNSTKNAFYKNNKADKVKQNEAFGKHTHWNSKSNKMHKGQGYKNTKHKRRFTRRKRRSNDYEYDPWQGSRFIGYPQRSYHRLRQSYNFKNKHDNKLKNMIMQNFRPAKKLFVRDVQKRSEKNNKLSEEFIHHRNPNKTNEMTQALRGQLTAKIVESIFTEVKNCGQFNTILSPGLENIHKYPCPLAQLDEFHNQEVQTNIKRLEIMLHDIMKSLNKIIEDEVRAKTCNHLDPDSKLFLDFITKTQNHLSKLETSKENIDFKKPFTMSPITEPVEILPKQGSFLFDSIRKTGKSSIRKMSVNDTPTEEIIKYGNVTDTMFNLKPTPSEEKHIMDDAISNITHEHQNQFFSLNNSGSLEKTESLNDENKDKDELQKFEDLNKNTDLDVMHIFNENLDNRTEGTDIKMENEIGDPIFDLNEKKNLTKTGNEQENYIFPFSSPQNNILKNDNPQIFEFSNPKTTLSEIPNKKREIKKLLREYNNLPKKEQKKFSNIYSYLHKQNILLDRVLLQLKRSTNKLLKRRLFRTKSHLTKPLWNKLLDYPVKNQQEKQKRFQENLFKTHEAWKENDAFSGNLKNSDNFMKLVKRALYFRNKRDAAENLKKLLNAETTPKNKLDDLMTKDDLNEGIITFNFDSK